MGILDSFGYYRSVDEISAAPAWPDSMLRVYGDMLSVSDVARALNLEERNVRNLLTSTDRSIRLREDRQELADFPRPAACVSAHPSQRRLPAEFIDRRARHVVTLLAELVDDSTRSFDALSPATREAWLQVTAIAADGL